ncbi:MAG: hypothetical protein O2807_07675 [bacterium]|nr:hypothetical protein [bacterium]
MDFLFEPPYALFFAALFLIAGAVSAWRGVRLFLKGFRAGGDPSRVLWLVRGIRGVIVALAMAVGALGVWLHSKWLLIFGIIFLLEEIYETGVVILALRAGKNAAHASPPPHKERTNDNDL